MIMTKKKTVGLLLIACLFAVCVASVYAEGNPFDRLDATFEEVKADLANLWNVVTDELRPGMTSLEAKVLALETKVATLEGENADLTARVSTLEATVADNEVRITTLEAAPPGLGAPDFDSGWQAISQGGYLNFDVGFDITENAFVYMVGRYIHSTGVGLIHQRYFGGDSGTDTSVQWGAYWKIDAGGDIGVMRNSADPMYDEVRVMVWLLPPP